MKQIVLSILLVVTALSARPSFLMPDEAFKPEAVISGPDKAKFEIKMGEDIYVYSEKFAVSDADDKDGIVIEAIRYDESVEHHGEQVFLKDPKAIVSLAKQSGISGTVTAKFKLAYQGCSEKGLCYEPLEQQFELEIDTAGLPLAKSAQAAAAFAAKPEAASAEPLSETDQIARTIKEGNLFWIVLSFFGFGLLLSLTPCIFPMIPILSSVIVSQGKDMTTRRAFVLSLVYVLSMSLAYTGAGIMAGLFGANLQAAFQDPWIISTFAVIFVLLALSMFDLYELQMPNFIQSKVTKAGESRGGIFGVAVMGFLSALIVGPCVAAPLAGALIYIGQTGDAFIGGVALFALSIGMGIPLLIVGTSAGRFMPRPGAWMDSIKAIFGVLLLGVAIWMISRVVDASLSLLMWSMLLVFTSVSMGALEPIRGRCVRCDRAHKKAFAILLFMYAVVLFVGSFTGATNPLDPLEKFRAVPATAAAVAAPAQNSFKVIHSIDEFERELAASKGKKVMLDFYADWCVSCKELEHNTFSDARVKTALAPYVLLQADVTSNMADEKALTKKFGLFGPPGIIFFNEQGERQKRADIVGYMAPDEFLAHLQKL